MPSPWLIIGALLAVIAAFFYGQHQGATSEKAAWLKRENVELTAANAKIIELNAKNRAIEQKAAADQNAIAVKLLKEKNDGIAKKDRVIADLRSGIIKLRGASACETAPRDSISATTTDTAAGKPTAGSQLLEESDLEYLVAEAGRADQIVFQLQACQAILVKDREAVNR